MRFLMLMQLFLMFLTYPSCCISKYSLPFQGAAHLKMSPPTNTRARSTASTHRRFWLIVASHNHATNAVQGGFIQANHGKRAPVQRMRSGDGVLVYSPKERLGEPAPCQKFTAIGTVREDKVYQVTLDGVVVNACTFEPWRRDVDWAKGAKAVSVRPLVEGLRFIRNKEKWGMTFRFGFVSLPAEDFRLVEREMLGGKAIGKLSKVVGSHA
jgi:hypothetical protein